MLKQSGLWENLREQIETGLAIGKEKINLASKQYWVRNEAISYEEQGLENIRRTKEIDERLVEKNKEGVESIRTDIVWYMDGNAKIKKMYFGKYSNEKYLREINIALETKTKYSSGRCEASYDVSFEYSPEQNKAWYSEEFRGCGNGHYYLALNSTHALFYEND